MTRLHTAIERINFSRNYMLRLLVSIAPGDWFRMSTPAVTHIEWQVGHLAMAEYRLMLFRVRDERPEDASLISPQVLRLFGKDSVPEPKTPHVEAV